MENNHGGAREGAGRKKGSGVKTEYMFGYKYSPEEKEFMSAILEEAKKEHKTTSKAILEIFKFYKNRNN